MDRTILLALGAVSVTMLALPAINSAQVPLHMSPQPVGANTIHGVGSVIPAGNSTPQNSRSSSSH